MPREWVLIGLGYGINRLGLRLYPVKVLDKRIGRIRSSHEKLMMNPKIRRRIALGLWWTALASVGVFVLPVCVALGGALYSIHPKDPDFWLQVMIHHYLIPCGGFGFIIGILASLPVVRNRWMSSGIPGLALLVFYVVFQQKNYQIEWSFEYLLKVFLPTWIPLVGFSLAGGMVVVLIRRMMTKCEYASANQLASRSQFERQRSRE